MNEPVPGWIEWGPSGVIWGPPDTPFLDRPMLDTMPTTRRIQTVAPKRRPPSQRVCLHGACGTILSRYNVDSDFCGVHDRFHNRVVQVAG